MRRKLVSNDFDVPEGFQTENYILEMLSPMVAELDYEAVITSRTRLRQVFAENDVWPKDDMTLNDNIKDLERHEKEFKSREAFAYTVLSPSKEKCIGCVYIDPPSNPEYDCEVYLWVRDSETHLDEDLFKNVKHWISTKWPFLKIAYPGREISWTQRNEIKLNR